MGLLWMQVRVVKSAKDRSFEAIRNSVTRIRNHIRINDWNGIQTDFEECNKHVDKSKVGCLCRRLRSVPSDARVCVTDLEELCRILAAYTALLRGVDGV